MSTAKASLILLALVAGVALVQAAGGIKGQRPDDSQRVQGLKGPRPQQPQYVQPQPQPQPQPQLQQQQVFRPAPAPAKGAGQVTPVFTAARVQPIQQQRQPIIQQQQQQQEQEPEPQQQQQQQETEIDPNAAAQEGSAAAIAPLAASAASEEEANPRPEPYNFNFAFEAGDTATSGSSQREEQQDANGKITGFYTLKGDDGRDRRVDYIADADGFRATVQTNELGTAPKNSADVEWQAQSPSDAQLRAAESATQAARQRALSNPQSLASASSSSKVLSSPRQNALGNGAQFGPATSATSSKVQQLIGQPSIAQLQEPFEQIRQTELSARARKSRHAPFYLFTV